ncbi:hypothetical protein FA375_09710 [Pseudomonas aeruginosa]|nr:hypothetical protein AO935_29610 [Pseudomonas aeruginosa]KSH60575.1 hypothetical protein AO969_03245 [Pseudomonas aeruginosa]MBK3753730.1 hypothetical protein [Pseudomonas aeruginosa]MBK3763967.1 hypothetical protein [Pseudomonas aeruginosa]MBK3769988.1 hypothetical protein [Pseudomonas aeruginosa]
MGGTRFAGVFPALRTFSSLLRAKAASGVAGEAAADDIVQVLRRGAPCPDLLAEEGASAIAGAEAYG